jgi:signal transduction histidine kinase
MTASRAPDDRRDLVFRVTGQVAHDFNNLLAPLTGYPDLILEDLPADHPAVPMVQSIRRVAERMAAVNLQLLTLSGRDDQEHEPLDLDQLVDAALRSLAPWSADLDLTVDRSTAPAVIMGAAAPLQQAVCNLLRNAIEAVTGAGGGVIRVGTACESDPAAGGPGTVRLTITDTGPGIDPADRDRLFEPFFTTRTGSERRGAGLGLCVVARVVEDHAGEVRIESKTGVGTTAEIVLPASTRPPASDPGR